MKLIFIITILILIHIIITSFSFARPAPRAVMSVTRVAQRLSVHSLIAKEVRPPRPQTRAPDLTI